MNAVAQKTKRKLTGCKVVVVSFADRLFTLDDKPFGDMNPLAMYCKERCERLDQYTTIVHAPGCACAIPVERRLSCWPPSLRNKPNNPA